MIKQNYELMYIIPLKYSGDLLQSTFDEVKTKLEEGGFEINLHEQFGKLKFAYKIEDQYQGFYFIVEFSGQPANIENFQNWLRLKKEVLRYILIKKIIGLKSSLEFGKEQLKQLESEKLSNDEVVDKKVFENKSREKNIKQDEESNSSFDIIGGVKEDIKNIVEDETLATIEEKKKQIKVKVPKIITHPPLAETEEEGDIKELKTEIKTKPKRATKKTIRQLGEEKKQDDKISLEEIDKKLDQILDSDIPTI